MGLSVVSWVRGVTSAWLVGVVLSLGCSDAPDGVLLRIENLSSASLRSGLSPGVWVVHSQPDPLFTEGAPDRGEGLERLAEDGDPSELLASLVGRPAGVFDLPSGATSVGALRPGEVYEREIFEVDFDARLSFATMVVETNDIFVAPGGEGLDLGAVFGGEIDVTSQLALWNAGTEVDQAPRLGPDQASRQAAPGAGSAEGALRLYSDATRALPLAVDLVELTVARVGDGFVLTFRNVSEERGFFVTTLSPLAWVLHGEAYQLWTPGAPASDALEALAEAADPRALVLGALRARGRLLAGAVATRVGVEEPGLLRPGEAYRVELAPDVDRPLLSIASKVGATNDAFVALEAAVRLIGEDGSPRSQEAVERDVRRALGVWDAGTEANEVPGAGWTQGADDGVDFGDDDRDPLVRLYDDTRNDLAGPSAGGMAEIEVRRLGGLDFEVSVWNRGDRLGFNAFFSSFVVVTHDESSPLLELGAPPSNGLMALGEDGRTDVLAAELANAVGVSSLQLPHLPEGAREPGPLRPGQRYVFTVTVDAAHPLLDLATMLFPSNDVVLAFEPPGLRLLDASGQPRSNAELTAEASERLRAWDLGTEQNQAAGGGRDQVPFQDGNDIGADEGDGTVRRASEGGWGLPPVEDLVRVTLTPISLPD